jgi:signal transduction histidine kinase
MMLLKKRILLLLLAFLTTEVVKSQFAAMDSIKNEISSATNSQQKLQAIQALLKFRNSLQGDTILFYSKIATNLAEKLNDKKQLRWAIYYQLTGSLAKGITDSIISAISNTTLLTFNKKEDATLYYKIQLLHANVLNRTNERVKALELQLKILDEAERDNDVVAQAYISNYTGATYYNLGQLNTARSFWFKALQLAQQQTHTELVEIEAVIYSNLCLYYGAFANAKTPKEMNDSLSMFINKSVAYSRQHNIYWILAGSLSIRGSYNGYKGNIELAENDFKEALEIRSKIGDPLYVSNDLINLAQFYYASKQYSKCIEVLQQVLHINATNHIIESNNHTLSLLSAAYKATGDYKSYSQTLERFITAADSAGRINAAEKIAEIQTRYEVQKKEALIAKQQLDLFKQNVILIGGSFVLFLATIIGVYSFRRYKNKQKIKLETVLLEEKRQSEAAVKEAQETERKRIAAELHDNLGVQATAILHNTTLVQPTDDINIAAVNNLKKTAKEMLINLRETLWAMKNTDVTAIELWLRIINFMKQMGRHYATIDFKIEGDPPADFILSSNKALNTVLIIQEAVNNAVKHAFTADIIATSKINANSWNITITDNGRGFNFKATQNKAYDSYGLGNMQERAAASGITLSITSEAEKGTVVALLL